MSKARIRGLKFWMGFCVVLGFVFLLRNPLRRVADVAAVQDAVLRDWEIGFGSSNGDNPPPMLPSLIDSAAESFFNRAYAKTYGYDGTQPAKTRNRAIVFHERFRAFFRPPIEEVHVYYFEGFHGDLGAALARFPKLRRVTVAEEEKEVPTEAEWTQLCRRLRSLPDLEEVELGGRWVTDAAIAPLAGHPRLGKVSITEGRLTSGCTKTFASMPRLAELEIGDQIYDGDSWLTSAEQEAMKAALPNVNITLP